MIFTGAKCALIAPLTPPAKLRGRKRTEDVREVLNTILSTCSPELLLLKQKSRKGGDFGFCGWALRVLEDVERRLHIGKAAAHVRLAGLVFSGRQTEMRPDAL